MGKTDLPAVVAGIGATTIVLGVGLWSLPAGLVLLGGFLIVAAIGWERHRQRR